jgi:predicted acetyltransferase
MAAEIRVPTDDDYEAIAVADGRAFGAHFTPEHLAEIRPLMDLDRFRIAVDGRTIVGVAGSYAMNMTLPGGATVPTGGVTWVSTALTHRRQGVLTRLMAAVHDDIHDRGEPLAALTAAEAAIYERFGYGMATRSWATSVDRRQARLQDPVPSASRRVRLLEADEARAHLPAVWERYRRTRPGETDRPEVLWDAYAARRSRPDGAATPACYLGHRDGYAVYRVTEQWSLGQPGHRLDLIELVALTAEAHRALWATLLDADLVGPIEMARTAPDEALPYLLTDFRALRTVSLNDGLWVNVRNLPTVFSARTYAVSDRLVVEVPDAPGGPVRLAIDGGPEGGNVRRVRSRADLTLSHASMGALSLGGVRPSLLAAAGRLSGRSAEAVRRADAFFAGCGPAPLCLTPF